MIENTRLYRLLRNTDGFVSLTFDGCEYVLMKRYRGEIQRYVFSDNTHFSLIITYNIKYRKHAGAKLNQYNQSESQLFYSLSDLESELKNRSLLSADHASIRFDGKSVIIYSKP